jgi:hypothetical protein
MGKYGGQLSSIGEETFVINKTGPDKDLFDFYAKLDGPHLLGFCKSGLIVEESLVLFDALQASEISPAVGGQKMRTFLDL